MTRPANARKDGDAGIAGVLGSDGGLMPHGCPTDGRPP